MPKSKWKVQSNYISGLGKRYIAFRIINENEPVHSGNIEHYGEYLEDSSEVQKIVDRLNEEDSV